IATGASAATIFNGRGRQAFSPDAPPPELSGDRIALRSGGQAAQLGTDKLERPPGWRTPAPSAISKATTRRPGATAVQRHRWELPQGRFRQSHWRAANTRPIWKRSGVSRITGTRPLSRRNYPNAAPRA